MTPRLEFFSKPVSPPLHLSSSLPIFSEVWLECLGTSVLSRCTESVSKQTTSSVSGDVMSVTYERFQRPWMTVLHILQLYGFWRKTFRA